MKRQFLTALVVAVATLTPVTALGQDGPLERIARRVPLHAEGMVMLTDVAASARQVAPFSAASPEMDRKLMPFGMLHPPTGFGLDLLAYFPNGAVSALGFSVFDIGQMAGCGPLHSVRNPAAQTFRPEAAAGKRRDE